MSHELEFAADGTASMFSLLETPWHKFGRILTAAPTYEDALRLGRLDYEVVKVPAQLPTGLDGALEPSKIVFATMRTDTRQTLGRVGPEYEVVQNIDAFGILRPLVDSGLLTLETGGVLRDGADAWLLGRWAFDKMAQVTQDVFGELGVLPFSTVLANHDGRRGVAVGNTDIRIVCANTLGMAETSSRSRWEIVRHTGDANARLIEAAEKMFQSVIQQHIVIAEQYRALKARVLEAAEFEAAVLDVIAGIDPTKRPEWNPEARMANAVIERWTAKRTTLTELWERGKGHVGDHSAWEAYNGAVEALDHDEAGLWPVKSGVYRTAALLSGTYAQLKNQVLDTLVRLAA